MSFAEKLKQAREVSGLTQQELSEQSGIARRTIQNWECGSRNPSSIAAIEKVAAILNVSTSDLIDSNEAFVAEAGEQFGYRGKAGADRLVRNVKGLFAGGDLAEEDMDEMMLAIQKAYIDAKKRNREKFTPKKYRDTTSDNEAE